jgi:hypothetical protein
MASVTEMRSGEVTAAYARGTLQRPLLKRLFGREHDHADARDRALTLAGELSSQGVEMYWSAYHDSTDTRDAYETLLGRVEVDHLSVIAVRDIAELPAGWHADADRLGVRILVLAAS